MGIQSNSQKKIEGGDNVGMEPIIYVEKQDSSAQRSSMATSQHSYEYHCDCFRGRKVRAAPP